MPPKKINKYNCYIKTTDGFEPVNELKEIDLSCETEQDRLNHLAVDALRKILPENMELVMNDRY